MVSNLREKEMIVNIEEKIRGNESEVYFKVVELDDLLINLSSSDVKDIREFFNRVFDFIVEEEKLITFKLDTNERDLFYEVAQDMVDYINQEIQSSEENFLRLINDNYEG